MSNERITEDIVRDHFKRDPLFDAITLEEQKSSDNLIKECLSKASKKGTKNPGYPEFIITIPALPNDIIVVECKSDEALHESENRDHPADYARDGVEHYAGFLSKEFNVIGIAVSGTNQTPRVSSFYQKSGGGHQFVPKKIVSFLASIHTYRNSRANKLQELSKAKSSQN